MKWHIDQSKLFTYNKLVRREKSKYSIQYTIEEYYLNGKYHNPNGPACIARAKGKILSTAYYINGKRHRTDGPAYSYTSLVGYKVELYFINDIRLTTQEIADMITS